VIANQIDAGLFAKMTAPERALYVQLQAEGLPLPEHNQTLIAGRKWRSDFCWRDIWLTVEVEGLGRKGARRCRVCGQTPPGAHESRAGYTDNCRKYNALDLAGWRVLRFTPDMIDAGEAIETLRQALGAS
jgi:very-short-patch-repair endonuclease